MRQLINLWKKAGVFEADAFRQVLCFIARGDVSDEEAREAARYVLEAYPDEEEGEG